MTSMRVARLDDPGRWALTEEQKNFGCLRTRRGALPLNQLRLRAVVRGLDYSLSLTQEFVNVHSDSLEAVYIFPLPGRAGPGAVQPRRDDTGVVQDQKVAVAKQRGQIPHMQVAHLVARHRQKPRRAAGANRSGGDQPCGQVEVEIVKFHGDALGGAERKISRNMPGVRIDSGFTAIRMADVGPVTR